MLLEEVLQLDLLHFFEYVKKINYGYKDKNGLLHYMEDEDFHNYTYAFSSPEEIINNNCGWCWDVAQLIREYCIVNNYQYCMLFVEYNNEDLHQTHTQVFVQYESIWYECPDNSSDYKFGTYKYESKRDCIESFKMEYIKYLEYVFKEKIDFSCLIFREYDIEFDSGISDTEFLCQIKI